MTENESTIGYYNGTMSTQLRMFPFSGDPTKTYVQISDQRDLSNINVNTEELVAAINKIPGVTATFETPTLPTVPGIYIGGNMAGRTQNAQIYKLKSADGWTDANGHPADIERVQELADLQGLIRLIPEVT